MVAVQRMIDAATKIGGQLSFRLANARQELRVDHAAALPSVRELVEYVQAEIEDMSDTVTCFLHVFCRFSLFSMDFLRFSSALIVFD